MLQKAVLATFRRGKPATAPETGSHRLRWLQALAPPQSLVTRVRWLHLLLALLVPGLTALQIGFATPTIWPLRALAIIAIVWLGWRRIREYRRAALFAPWWDVVEALALLAVGLAIGMPRLERLLYPGSYFRALHGSRSRLIVGLLFYTVIGYFVAPALHAAAEAKPQLLSLEQVFGSLPLLISTWLVYILGSILAKHERSVARERVVQRAGAALMAATDRERIYPIGAEAALDLVRRAPGTQASVCIGPPERLTVVAAAGDRATDILDARINLRALPEPFRDPLLAGQPASLIGKRVDLAAVRENLGFEPKAGSVSAVPLFLQDRLQGLLVVASDAVLPSDYVDGLQALGSLLTLALESADLTADLHRRRGEERFRALVQHSSDVITVVDADGAIRYESPSIERVLGYTPDELLGTNAFAWIHPDDVAWAHTFYAEVMTHPGRIPTIELRLRHKDGSWRVMEVTGSNLLAEPVVDGIVINARDITERKRAEEQLQHQAFHDALTDLPNRALFLDRLGHALARGARQPAGVAVLFLDLDGFKVINDSLGHEAGDRLLVAVAERLRQCVRTQDTVARLGGDEFTLLLEDLADPSEAVRVAERILRALQIPVSLDGRDVVVSASIGIVLGSAERAAASALMRDGDIAMYRAKHAGKGRYEVFDPSMSAAAAERLELEADLRRGLERGEFTVYYQPQVALATGRLVGMEALVRWEHPVRGLISPAIFIPLAEETGLIRPLGHWVLREACRQARAWRERRPAAPLTVAVNLSAREFQQPDLVAEVEQVLRDTGLAPACLELEITESVVMLDAWSTTSTLQALHDLGVKLAIDDFGTGYSSLSYLKHFPVDTIKIDKAFVAGLGDNREDTAIVEAVITLAHTLGMRVTAEGVERTEQLAGLRALGCDVGQGYYFDKPLRAEAAGALLARNARAVSPRPADSGEQRVAS